MNTLMNPSSGGASDKNCSQRMCAINYDDLFGISGRNPNKSVVSFAVEMQKEIRIGAP